MLRTLSIRDVVLIDELDLTFQSKLGVLTGETGAGKSILLDALGLALGARADSALVRHGTKQAIVAAAFDLPKVHPARTFTADQGINIDNDALILRRVLGADGRSRAFANDQPISIGLLRSLGETLVDVHGQFENQRLLEPAAHRGLLDAFGGHDTEVRRTRDAYHAWRAAVDERVEAEATVVAAQRDEEFLRHAVDELTALAPQAGEETVLADQRSLLMHGEKLVEAVSQTTNELTDNRGVEAQLHAAQRHLERAVDKAEGRFDAALAALDRAAVETAEAVAVLECLAQSINLDPKHLEAVEERLFALRAMARKHNVTVESLAPLRDDLLGRLTSIEDGGTNLKALTKAEIAARAAYIKAADALSAARRKTAVRLEKSMVTELAPLRLGQVIFLTAIKNLDEGEWNATGQDKVAFVVSTNPGTPPGSLARISSGGELARFMLALKVILAEADPVPTIIFDEVDSGVGGAVAAAVGERLVGLAKKFQVLVVTHSPQVASMGTHHFCVSKSGSKSTVYTSVARLDETARMEEIARMLSGARITDEARAAAESLLRGRQP